MSSTQRSGHDTSEIAAGGVPLSTAIAHGNSQCHGKDSGTDRPFAPPESILKVNHISSPSSYQTEPYVSHESCQMGANKEAQSGKSRTISCKSYQQPIVTDELGTGYEEDSEGLSSS